MTHTSVNSKKLKNRWLIALAGISQLVPRMRRVFFPIPFSLQAPGLRAKFLLPLVWQSFV